ncbi:MAG TPA: UpxY family transcription antiterminator [Melioribacteraceae bacterium]|nr:UpxY family transcription antiterminator [Melioribacteraceae bacterium]
MNDDNNLIELRKWYALYTKPRQEFKAEQQLKEMEITTYLPLITKVKQWSDRKKKVIEPLFKSYIFINANNSERYISVQAKSIVKIVNFKGVPATIPNWQIENLQKMLVTNPDAFVSDLIKIGTHVKIVEGPFAGVEGIVAKYSNDERVLGINIETLQRSVIVHLPANSVIIETNLTDKSEEE